MKNQIVSLMVTTAIFAVNPVLGMKTMKDVTDSDAAAAQARFKIQDERLNQSAYAHLKKAGLSKGQIVCVIDCRTGAITEYIAQEVGEAGHVYALASNEEDLNSTKERIKSKGLNNVTFFQGDLQSLKDIPMGSADVVHMRFVLMHQKDPESVVRAVKGLLKDGGVVASQESIMSASHCSSPNEVFGEYVRASIDLGKKLGHDYDIGDRLEGLYKQAGYVNTNVYFIQPQVGITDVKAILPSILAEGKRAAEAGIITSDKVTNWGHTITNWPDDDTSFSYAPAKQAYVLAWKGR